MRYRITRNINDEEEKFLRFQGLNNLDYLRSELVKYIIKEVKPKVEKHQKNGFFTLETELHLYTVKELNEILREIYFAESVGNSTVNLHLRKVKELLTK